MHLHLGSLAVALPDGRFANRSVLFRPDGEIEATYDKIHLFDATLPGLREYRESQTYAGGETAVGNISTTAVATAYNTSSDRELKQNIEDPQGLWDELLALRPRRFEFRAQPGKPVIGLIAQEVYDAPFWRDLVAGTPDRDLEKDGPMGIDFSKLVPALLWAVQDHERRLREARALRERLARMG